jgi:hypothetical protein
MLEAFTIQTFADRVGDTFRVGDGSNVIEMELVDASGGTSDRVSGAAGRVPFSVVFRGPLQPILPQRIYRFEHDSLGAFDLFIVPIGPEGDGMQYEAVFT